MDFLPSHRLRSLMTARSHHAGEKCEVIPVFLVLKRLRRERVPMECHFSGFHGPEQIGDRRFLWTTARGVLDCRFPAPHRVQYAWLELDATAPEGSTISVRWNEELVVRQQPVRGRVAISFKLPESAVVEQAKIVIESTTFVPQIKGMGDDARELGVAIRGLILAKRRSKYRARSAFPTSLRTRVYKLLPKWTRQRLSRGESGSPEQRAA